HGREAVHAGRDHRPGRAGLGRAGERAAPDAGQRRLARGGLPQGDARRGRGLDGVILRAALLLVRLRARRLLNLMSGRRKKGAPRSGTGRPMAWGLPLFVISIQALAAVVMSWSTILQARMQLDGEGIVSANGIAPLSPGVQGEVALLAALACLVG